VYVRVAFSVALDGSIMGSFAKVVDASGELDGSFDLESVSNECTFASSSMAMGREAGA